MHSQHGQKASSDIKKHLIDNDIAYNDLCYEADSIGPCLTALSTWFYNDEGQRIVFTEMPVLTYDEIYWESDDGSVTASKRLYAVQVSDLPADFIAKAVKVS
jgi:hypothetical protein